MCQCLNRNAAKLFQLKYSDIYGPDDSIVAIENIREATGLDFTVLQILSIRGTCSTAKIKYKKISGTAKGNGYRDIFIGSGHLRKILYPDSTSGIPHNINKFANNLDIIISGEQSKFLNRLWTNSIFSSKKKLLFF
jgi:hypothetical protein